MTAGGRTRARTAAIALIAFAGFMHVFAYWTVASFANANLASDTATLVGITGSLVLSWSLLLSQGMESVTRAFYSRFKYLPCAWGGLLPHPSQSPCCWPRHSSMFWPCWAAADGFRPMVWSLPWVP